MIHVSALYLSIIDIDIDTHTTYLSLVYSTSIDLRQLDTAQAARLYNFYHTTRMHSADYAVARCLSVC